jgi:hypothetical protein
LQATLARPESASEAVPAIATGEAKTLDPSEGEVKSRLGGVLSIFTVTEATALFPA